MRLVLISQVTFSILKFKRNYMKLKLKSFCVQEFFLS
jgi:hypothetical protein